MLVFLKKKMFSKVQFFHTKNQNRMYGFVKYHLLMLTIFLAASVFEERHKVFDKIKNTVKKVAATFWFKFGGFRILHARPGWLEFNTGFNTSNM